MANDKKTRAELVAENKLLRKTRASRDIANVLETAIKWFGLCFISTMVYWSVEAVAGQKTTADIGVNILADIRLSDVFAYLFAGSGIAYGLKQRNLRKSTVERLQSRVKESEVAVDPNRSSSGLTPRGDTHPYDK